MNILDDFFEGKLYPADKKPNNPEYQKAVELNEKITDKLKAELSKKQFNRIKDINFNHLIIEYEYGKEMFLEGLSMGIMLTAEAFSKK